MLSVTIRLPKTGIEFRVIGTFSQIATYLDLYGWRRFVVAGRWIETGG